MKLLEKKIRGIEKQPSASTNPVINQGSNWNICGPKGSKLFLSLREVNVKKDLELIHFFTLLFLSQQEDECNPWTILLS
jgi:hypothetical protein